MIEGMTVPVSRLVRTAVMTWAIILSFSSTPCRAQLLYGSLVGNVTDESHGPVLGAEVTITKKETNLVRTAKTNEEGLYGFPNLPSGTYSVKVMMPGFADFQQG